MEDEPNTPEEPMNPLANLSPEIQAKIQELQMLEQSFQQLLMQKNAFSMESNETDFIITEVEKTEGEVSRIIGNQVVIKSTKEEILADMKKKKELIKMRKMVDQATTILSGDEPISYFGELLHESWLIKKSLSSDVSSSNIDNIYETAREAGAIGGKLLGAGGGGFMLIFAKPEDQPAIKEKLKNLFCIPFEFENQGSQIIVFQPDSSTF